MVQKILSGVKSVGGIVSVGNRGGEQMPYDKSNTTLYAGIIIALIIGAAVGYFVYPTMNPNPDQGSSAFKLGYDEGFEDGFTEGQKTTGGDQEVLDSLAGLATLIYGVIGASLIAALAAIVTLMSVSRKIA